MNKSIVKKAGSVVKGSMQDIADQQFGGDIQMSWVMCELIVLCDVSGSMSTSDSRGGDSRYNTMKHELGILQNENPGVVAVVSFGSDVEWNPGGVPSPVSGTTNMAAALRFAKQVDGLARICLISDGEPDSESEALRVAQTYVGPIDTIFVGPEGGGGREFLKKLANASGGKHQDDFSVRELGGKIAGLLPG